MKYNKIWVLLFLAIAVFCFGCGKEGKQTTENKPDIEPDRENQVSFTKDLGAELPDSIYNVYAKKADIEEEQILQQLIENYDDLKDQIEKKEEAEGTKYTLAAEGISYEWTLSGSNFNFQRLSDGTEDLVDKQMALEECSHILGKMGFEAAGSPAVKSMEESGYKYYDIKYKFFYKDMKVLWDLPFENPYDSQAEEGISGEELEISYDSQGVKAFYIYGLRSIGEVKETIAPHKIIAVNDAIKRFEDYMTEFDKSFGTDINFKIARKYKLKQAELIYIPMPDTESKQDLMIPAWYLKMDSEERYQEGEEENIIKTTNEVLIDALTGYVYRAN